ncbi:glycosyltransferase family 2 protein [Pseudomonas sp. SJZ131]|uniref:glycosyltransferase family 2 protein n=1 Tax=Pseudomonas sp. SJZ131 TaxID=2572895 RepID=UPI0021147564|nr:glycosyltransferase [Pseudomonas sp. SJZ131]
MFFDSKPEKRRLKSSFCRCAVLRSNELQYLSEKIMVDVDYLVSVVVPTHNRSQYAIHCIESLLDIDSELLQVVVHDTSNDECELAQWAGKNLDSRLRYVHWVDRLSMTENHERAMRIATGEYICLIGDDDSVSERIIEVAAFAKNKGIKMITPKVKALYYWPDFRTKMYGAAHAGRVYLSEFDQKIEYMGSLGNLNVALHAACQGTDELPKLYHGLVHHSLIDQLRESNGQVFFGTSPDMSASVALSLLGHEYALIDLPFTMPGGAGGSNSGRSAAGKHKGDLKSDPHIAPFKNLEWPEIIPHFFSVETVWAHAAWTTLNGIGGAEQLKKFNLARLYALCAWGHKDYLSTTRLARLAAVEQGYSNVRRLDVFKELLVVISKHVLSRFKRLLKPSASNGREVLAVVPDVRLARQELDKNLRDRIKSTL